MKKQCQIKEDIKNKNKKNCKRIHLRGKNTLIDLSKSDKSIGAVTQELLPSLLPREIGLVRVTGLFQDKFANEKYPWVRQKEERNRP